MNSYTFELAHGYKVILGCVSADTIEEARKKVEKHDWDDIVDEWDSNELVEGYELKNIW